MSKRAATDRYYQRMKQFEEEVSLYPVTCEPLSAGRSDRQWLDAVLAGGAKIVQLRDKVNRDNVVLEKAKYFRQRTREAGALFIINDRVDIGLLAEADGIHVGQGDLPPAELRRLAADMIIGLSCNTVEDVKALARGGDSDTNPVSYYNIGPIYATATKEGLQHFLGTGAVADFSRYSSLPFTVMGGIKQHHVADLVAAGAKRIAVVTAISRAVDIEQETARWIQLIDESANDGKNKRQ